MHPITMFLFSAILFMRSIMLQKATKNVCKRKHHVDYFLFVGNLLFFVKNVLQKMFFNKISKSLLKT